MGQWPSNLNAATAPVDPLAALFEEFIVLVGGGKISMVSLMFDVENAFSHAANNISFHNIAHSRGQLMALVLIN